MNYVFSTRDKSRVKLFFSILIPGTKTGFSGKLLVFSKKNLNRGKYVFIVMLRRTDHPEMVINMDESELRTIEQTNQSLGSWHAYFELHR